VNVLTDRNESKWQNHPRLDVRVITAQDLASNLNSVGSEYITLLAVSVLHQRNTGCTIRVVLDAGNLARDAHFIPLHINDAISALMTTTDIAARSVTEVITTTTSTTRSK
jgi:hypothetical protein